MATPTPPSPTARFSQLLSLLPVGRFYDASGYVVPYSSSPTAFRWETSTPSQTHNIFVNAVFQGVTTTDINGIAVFSILLRQGRNDITLVNLKTNQSFVSFVDARKLATWYASYADVIQGLDLNVEDAYAARSLGTVSANYAEDVYGLPLTTPNNLGYSLRSYVNGLQELRQSYRDYATTPISLRAAVAAFTAVNPFIIPDELRPEWVVGSDLAPNGGLQQLTRTATALTALAGVDLPNINQVSRTYVVSSILDNAAQLIYTPAHQPPFPQQITVSIGGTWAGGNITLVGLDQFGNAVTETITPVINSTVASSFTYSNVTTVTKATQAGAGATLTVGVAVSRYLTITSIGPYNTINVSTAIVYTPGSPDTLQWDSGASYSIAGIGGPYVLTTQDLIAQINGLLSSPYNLDPLGAGGTTSSHIDQVTLSADGKQPVIIDLSGLSTTPTAAQVATAINTALSSAYGAGYNTTASAITGTEGVAGPIVRLVSQNLGALAAVSIEAGPFDASPNIFGLARTHTTLSSAASAGALSLTVVNGALFPPISAGPKQAKFSNANPTISGVGFGAPSTSTSLGLGSLKLVVNSASDKELSYQSPGDGAYGLSHNVVNGGTFTLVSNNGTDSVVVFVTAAVLNATNQSATFTEPVQVFVPGQFHIRVRGRRFNATDGQIAGTTVLATFTSATATFSAADVGGYIRVSGGSSGVGQNNNGVHQIIGFTNATTVTIRNAGAATGTVFANQGPGLTYSLWNNGEIHLVTKIVGNVITLNDALSLTWPGNVSVYVERANELPAASLGIVGPGKLNVTINPTFKPSGAQTDHITPVGVNIPDGWNATGGTFTASVLVPGYLHPARLLLRSTSAGQNITFFRSLGSRALTYAGYPMRAAFWVEDHSAASATYTLDVSMDGGSTWSVGPNTTITGYPYVNNTNEGSLAPQPIRRIFYVTNTATDVWIRLVRVSAGENPLTISIERATVEAITHTSCFLGVNTIPRSNQRSNFEELIYVWSPDQLTANEDRTIGLVPGNTSGQTSPNTPGHIDLIMPAHESIDRFDVSEFDGSGNSLNLFGIFHDADWASSVTLTNMQVIVGTPGRLTYARPIRVSAVPSEQLAFTTGIGGEDSLVLSQTTAFEGITPPGTPDGSATLLGIQASPVAPGDVLVVPDTLDSNSIQPWNWIVGNKIHINSAWFDPSLTYLFNYNAMIRAESGAILIPVGTMTNYLWQVNVSYYTRSDLGEGSDATVEQLTFRGDYTAILSGQSDQDLATSVLLANNGSTITQVPQANWSYLDAQTVRIDSSVFDPNSLYTFSYDRLFPRIAAPASVRIDWRSASSQVALSSATYATVQNGQVVNPIDVNGTYNAYHQIRVTLSGVVDVRDVRIYSMGLKGVHIFGTSPFAPGVILTS